MKLPVEEKARLEALCHQFRIDLIETLHQRQTGHPGGSLSVLEILTTLYFTEMDVDPANPQKPDRDRLVLCKGHAAPALYRILAEKGFFPVEQGFNLCSVVCSLLRRKAGVSSDTAAVSSQRRKHITRC